MNIRLDFLDAERTTQCLIFRKMGNMTYHTICKCGFLCWQKM